MRLLNGAEMRAVDRASTEKFGIPGELLMENAALAAVAEIGTVLDGFAGKRAVIFCGTGNNGGDGFAIVRHLLSRGMDVRVFMLGSAERLSGDAKLNYEILYLNGTEVQQITEQRQINLLRLAVFSADIIVDAILGTGLSGEVEGVVLDVIELINDSGGHVLSVDIPSGLCAERGLPLPLAVKADVTVTFGYAKIGLVLPAALPYTGKLVVADISLPAEALEYVDSRRELVDIDFCRRWLVKRERESHKGDYGHVLVAGGSLNMPGAPSLSAAAALRAGAGLVTAALPQCACLTGAINYREVMLLRLPDSADGGLNLDSLDKILGRDATAMVIGPGMGRAEETAELVYQLLPKLKCPIVVDADALYFLKNRRDIADACAVPLIFTPHAGEFARLSGLTAEEIEGDRLSAAADFAAEWGVILVLKGAATVIADPDGRIFVNSSGNPGMATGGSGDVLAGVIAALLAQKLPPVMAAAVGVYLHGLAGDLAAADKTETAMIAGDIIEYLPAAFKKILL